MTTDSLLDRVTRTLPRPAGSADRSDELDQSSVDDYGAFGWLRGIRDRVPMLEFRQRNGNIRACGYAWLQQAEFDPSIGIVLSFGTVQVTLIGRNLNTEVRPTVRLFQGITRQKVPYLQEADEATILRSRDGDPVIERIVWS
jgi:hypothetical protein